MTRLVRGDETRQRRVHRFVQVPRSAVRDWGLSIRARGLLMIMLDLPDNWVIRAEWLAAQFEDDVPESEGREAVAAALRQLRRRGYYRVERRHMPDGTYKTGGYISDEAVPEWAASYRAAVEALGPTAGGKVRSPKWDALVRVLSDGSIEGEEPDEDDVEQPAPPVTDSDEADTPTGPQESVTGPVPGKPESGGPESGPLGTLRETEKEDREGTTTSPSSSHQSNAGARARPAPPRTAELDPLPPAPAYGLRRSARAQAEWEATQRLLEKRHLKPAEYGRTGPGVTRTSPLPDQSPDRVNLALTSGNTPELSDPSPSV